jgi:hypothetical protein
MDSLRENADEHGFFYFTQIKQIFLVKIKKRTCVNPFNPHNPWAKNNS